MLQNWIIDKLIANEHENFIYQQDGAPPHWKLTVRAYLNNCLSRKWIGRGGGEDNVVLKWPPRSPDLTPCEFFSMGIGEELDLCPPLPANLNELQQRITITVSQGRRSFFSKTNFKRHNLPPCAPVFSEY